MSLCSDIAQDNTGRLAGRKESANLQARLFPRPGLIHHRTSDDRIDSWALLARRQTWERKLPILWLRKTFWMR